MMSGRGLLPCLGRHSLRPENSTELPRQVQSRHGLVCDQRQSAARPEHQGPVFDEIGHTTIWIGYGGYAFGVGITTAVIKREFVNSRQADQAST